MPQAVELLRDFRDRLRSLTYVEDDRFMIKILLKDHLSPVMVESNGEEAFGETGIYRAGSGEFAISFDTSLLEIDDRQVARLIGTEVVEITTTV